MGLNLRSALERLALKPRAAAPVDPMPGEMYVDEATGKRYSWRAGSWRELAELASGLIPLSNLPVAPSGNANATQLVRADDARLSLDARFPIGSVYFSAVNTSPAGLFGGTWTALPAGRFIATVDPSQTEFDTVLKTGGSKTVTLTSAQSGMPAHGHGVNDPSHGHPAAASNEMSYNKYESVGGAGLSIYFGGGAPTHTGYGGLTNVTVYGAYTGVTVQNAAAQNAASAHDNLSPYVTLYAWRRTA